MWCIVYLASPISHRVLLGEKHLMTRIDLLKASITITKRVYPDIDIILFHEDYTEQEFSQLPGVKHFVKVDFETNSDGFIEHYRPKGYMMMCRFFSGIMQRHPILQQYSHYMRLDDDSYFLDPYPKKKETLLFLNSEYVFRTLFHDKKEHHQLFEYTVDHLKKWDKDVQRIYPELRDIGFLDSDNKYTGLAPYNNFHTSSLSFWRNPIISTFVDSLEKDKCIMKYGWMDANIHAMIIFVLAPFAYKDPMIRHCGTFGYRHNQHVSHMYRTEWYYNSNLSFIEDP